MAEETMTTVQEDETLDGVLVEEKVEDQLEQIWDYYYPVRLCARRELAFCYNPIDPIEFDIKECLGCRGCPGLDEAVGNVQTVEPIITCAKEWLDYDCDEVHYKIQGVLCYLDSTGKAVFANGFTIEDTCDTFFDFYSYKAYYGKYLKKLLKDVDGSCLAVDVHGSYNSATGVATVYGAVVDKLWKYDNIEVKEAKVSYPRGVAIVPDVFDHCHDRTKCCKKGKHA